ncbi:MAG: hypothetical protein EWM72_01443 [Nitrospira sp.]|nr:MAG: hypothetical protein EWM72_01443 [Nitrospira sp.]
MSGARERRIWTSLVVALALLMAPAALAWAQDGELQARPRVELSLRSWLFTAGETKWSHNASGLDPRLGNPTSKLTYKDNDTHIIELAGRVNVVRRWFVQGDVGFSVSFNRGLNVDDDFTAVGGQQLFSRTHSDVTGSGTQYVNLNVGYRAVEFSGRRGYLDVFGGLQYWRTEYEATGVRQEVCNPSGIPGLSCTPNLNLTGVLAITNTTHWITPIHVGLNTEYRFTRHVSMDFKASVSPVSVLYNEDVHHLRTDLQQDPSFSMWGLGVSANAGASLKFMLTRNLALTGGYRVMWNRTYTGTWENHPVGGGSETAPLTEFQTIRHGATVGLTASF